MAVAYVLTTAIPDSTELFCVKFLLIKNIILAHKQLAFVCRISLMYCLISLFVRLIFYFFSTRSTQPSIPPG